MKIGFDLISDLNLTQDDVFNWEGKATSLYCIIAGNISSDPRVVILVLNHLARFYQGIFYVPGELEFQDCDDFDKRLRELGRYCKKIRNVALLHHHVVIIDGVAVLGANGWITDRLTQSYDKIHDQRLQDFLYLRNSIEKLQKHLDVKKILLISSSVPAHQLYFGEMSKEIELLPELNMTLVMDSESKVSHWAFGTYKKIVDTTVGNVNYISNPYIRNIPYWARRIDIET
jgi:hypothetical protein